MKDFLIANWKELLFILTTLISIGFAIVREVKNGKKLSLAMVLDIVKDKVKEFSETAETFANYTPEEKHLFVKTRIKEYLLTQSTTIDDDVLDKIISDDILHTKKINQREKDKNANQEDVH